ncbi:kinase-like domain-containing protein, partial [Chaetomium tenue]
HPTHSENQLSGAIILNGEDFEKDDELETDLEAFAELKEDSIGLGKVDGNCESYSKQSVHDQKAPGDGESDETDLRSRLEAAFVGGEHGNRFLPAQELDRLLTEQAIKRTILANHPEDPILGDILSATRPGVSPSRSLRKTFAVLTLLDRLGDISQFLSKEIRDVSLPLSEELLKEVWPGDLQTAAEFGETQWQVLAPVFKTSSGDSPKVYHYSLDDRAILPFYSDDGDDPIQGGYSKVHKVRIHDSHMSPASGHTLFAVKTLHKSPGNNRAFARERSSLRRFSGLGMKDNPHVVKLLATFEHKDAYSFLFPWAEKDLAGYWQSEPDERHSGATLTWIAEQCLGLANGLKSIHDLNGRHGDIKPENILWVPRDAKTGTAPSGGTLMISDFGLARWHTAQSKSARPQKLSGTPTYRPPECDLTDGRISDAWDTWSLGCVLLEFATWYVLGSQGVLADFPRARTQTLSLGQPQDILDDSFFTLQKQDGKSSLMKSNLKPSVKNQFRNLRQHPFCSKFISDFLDLIEFGMLETSPEKRFDSSYCVQVLEPLRLKLDLDHNYGKPKSALLLEMPPPTEDHLQHVVKSEQTECSPSFVVEEDADRLEFTLHEAPPSEKPGYRFDTFRRWLDRQIGAEVDWWPLPRVQQELPPGHMRLSWAYGGRQMSITLDPDSARRWRNASTRGTTGSTPILPTSAKPFPPRATTIQRHLTALWNWTSRKPPKPPNPSTTAPKPPPTPPPAPTCWRESYLCADRSWTSAPETKLSTLSTIDTMADDHALFTEARRVLNLIQGNRLQRFFSWRAYTRVQLSQFHFLFDNSDYVKTFSYPTLNNSNQTICAGYEFTTPHHHNTLPIDVQIHMQIIAETILQGLRRPTLGLHQRTVLRGMPKRRAPPGLRKQALASGWAFHAGRGPCVVRMGAWVVSVVGVGLVFVPVWLGRVSEVDLQGALAPGGFLVTVLGVVVALVCLVG